MLRPRRERLGIKSPAEFHHFPRVASARVSSLCSPTRTQSKAMNDDDDDDDDDAFSQPCPRPSVHAFDSSVR
jgi:hypothetical protein